MKSLVYIFTFISVLIYPHYASADNKSEFINICEQPNREQLITVEQIATNVKLKYKPALCGDIYDKIQNKKSFFDSGDYLLTLSPLYYLDNLETIYVSLDSSVTQINFSGIKNLHNLKTLSIRGTHPTAFFDNALPQITGTDSFSQLTYLTTLILHNLGITNIHFLGQIRKIKYVDISKNKITQIESGFLPTSLLQLNLSNNFIEILPDFSHLTSLQSLNISHNPYNDISGLAGTLSLEELNLSRAVLSEGHLTGVKIISTFSNLERLYIPGWNIDNIDFLSKLKSIEELYLQNNNISEVNALVNLHTLKSIDLTRNKITDLSPLIPLMSNYNINLFSSDNPLRNCSPKTVEQMKAGITCKGGFFNNAWNSIKRLFL